MKIGGNFDTASNRSVRNQARTTLTANGRSGGDVDALVGLLLARFETAARSFGSTERQMSQKSVGLFMNDDWKVTSRLTLSAGLRYELFTPTGEQNNLATNFFVDKGLVQLGTNGLDQLYKADKNNFGPRAGLGMGSDRRWPHQHQGRLRAHLRQHADRRRPPRAVLDADARRLPRVVLPAAGRRPRQPVGEVSRPEQLHRRRRLRLPAVGRAGLRLLAHRRAAVQHLPGARRLPLGLLPLFPRDVPARVVPQQLGDRVVRRLARPGPGLAQGNQRGAARLADDGQHRQLPAVLQARFRSTAALFRSPTTASRGTTASSCPSARTGGTA